MRRNSSRSTWAVILTIFLGLAAASVVLPGCGDDSGNDSQRQFPD
jgi:hypothetical protein